MMLVSCAAETIFTGLAGGGFATVYEARDPAGDLRRLLRRGPRARRPDGRPGHGDRDHLRRSARAVRDRSRDGRRARCPRGRSAPVGALGPAALDRRRGSGSGARRTGPRSPPPTPSSSPASCRRCASARGTSSTAARTVRCSRPATPCSTRTTTTATSSWPHDPRGFYRGAYADALLDVLADGSALARPTWTRTRCSSPPPAARCSTTCTCSPAATTWTTCWARCRRPAAAVLRRPAPRPGRPRSALVAALRAPDRRAETTNLVAVDERGDACVITTSLGLGSGVWVPGYGVHLNSMLGEGELLAPPWTRVCGWAR